MTVVVLGIDGLDWNLVARDRTAMPHVATYGKSGVLQPLRSTFPADSIPAWTTIFTGLPPEEHGILGTIDYLGKRPEAAADAAPDVLRGRTFWDVISRAGKSVCVVNPFLAYPAWPVNGVMATGPVFVNSAEPSVFPSAAGAGPLPELGGITAFPTRRTLSAFVRTTNKTAELQHRYAVALFQRYSPDFVFFNLLTLDRLQHFLWRYHDPSDPTYPGPNDWQDEVMDAYRQVDSLVLEWDRLVGSEGTVVVLSDHGHGQRASRMVFVDEILRRAGLLDPGGLRARTQTLALETLKRATLRAAYATRTEDAVFALARHLPRRKVIKNATYAVSTGSVVRTSRLFGRNGFGGVEVVCAGPAEREVADEVVAALSATRDHDGSIPFAWVARRDEVLNGTQQAKFPAVLYELRDGFATDFGLFRPIFGADPLHRRVSGGHRPHGIFAASRPVPMTPAELKEVHGAVLAAVGVEA